MIRTQVYLPKDLYTEVALVAKRGGRPRAAVIRELLESSLAKKRKQKNGGEGLLELAKLGEKLNLRGPRDLSINHNKYYEGI